MSTSPLASTLFGRKAFEQAKEKLKVYRTSFTIAYLDLCVSLLCEISRWIYCGLRGSPLFKGAWKEEEGGGIVPSLSSTLEARAMTVALRSLIVSSINCVGGVVVGSMLGVVVTVEGV
ncbi:hypothetical protein BDY24DRAFT_372812 [Mrakia frigida]|uniref:uncharacterized protein n=1 Tax=Mrakia frigida TaxID=29902 RepID=UPI003FCBF471